MNTPNRSEVQFSSKRPRTTFKIYQDDVKHEHTSHWDWDYLPREEIAQLASTRPHQEPMRAINSVDQGSGSRPFLLGALGAAAAAALSGVLLFAG